MKKRVSILFAMISCTIVLVSGCEKQKNESVKEIAESEEVGTGMADHTEEIKPVQIITKEDIENIVEIDYYYSDEKNVISDKAAIEEIATEIAKLELEDVVPENQMLEGGMMVELVMENGDIIYMSCGDSVIGLDKQYYVKNQLYLLIMEKGEADATGMKVDTEETKPVQIITEEEIKNIVEIDYYYADERHVISDKDVMKEIAAEIAKLQLEDVVPEHEWLEGGMGVELVLGNGNRIEFGCGDSYVGFGKQQYYVKKDLYSLIMEKGKAAATEMADRTEETKPVQIITEEEIENVIEIDYYYSDEKNVILDKAAIKEISEEIARLQLEDVIPENQWLEGDMGVELILDNGDIITFGCGVEHIGFGKQQYYVEKDLYSLIMEKGKEKE